MAWQDNDKGPEGERVLTTFDMSWVAEAFIAHWREEFKKFKYAPAGCCGGGGFVER